jgi:uncharacterized surface protein with fasciclin (FAS1) repeats
MMASLRRDRSFLVFVVLFFFLFSMSTPSAQVRQDPQRRRMTSPSSTTTIADLIVFLSSSDYSLLQLALQKTFLWSVLNDTTQVLTFLGPADASFQSFISLPPYSNYFTNDWTLHLQQVILYHILPHHILNSSQLFASSFWPTALGVNLPVDSATHTIGGNGASLVITNELAVNGYWHVPNQVLLPAMLQVTLQQVLFQNQTTTSSSASSPLDNYKFDTTKALFQLTKLDQVLAASSGDTPGLTLLALPDTAWQALALQQPTLAIDLFQADSIHVTTSILLYHMASINIYPNLIFGTTPFPELYITMQNHVSAWFTATTTTTTTTTPAPSLSQNTNHTINTTTATTTTTNTTTTTVFVNGATILVDNILASNG